MTVFSKVITSTDAGGTSDTFTDLGNIELNDQARYAVGIGMYAENITTTTAEGNHGQYEFDFTSMGGPLILTHGPPNTGAAIATQSTTGITNPVVLPLDNIPVNPGGKVGCKFSHHTPDPTAGCSVIMQLMYSDGAVSPSYFNRFPGIGPFYDSDTEALADAKAASETACTALEVPADASRIVGFGHTLIPDAVQANGEECVGFVRYKSTLSKNFLPQEYPLPGFAAPLAGTTVGTGCWNPAMHINYVAADIPCPSASAFTVTPYSYMNVALSAAVSLASTVYWVQ
jgi:hypothetical protein